MLYVSKHVVVHENKHISVLHIPRHFIFIAASTNIPRKDLAKVSANNKTVYVMKTQEVS